MELGRGGVGSRTKEGGGGGGIGKIERAQAERRSRHERSPRQVVGLGGIGGRGGSRTKAGEGGCGIGREVEVTDQGRRWRSGDREIEKAQAERRSRHERSPRQEIGRASCRERGS